jgi:TIGR03089 family protein
MPSPVIKTLAEAVVRRGGEPLLTWYDPSSSARTELSVRTFANWVDKTANLLRELDAENTVVAGPVSVSNPGHWMSLIWPLAAWQAGCRYTTMPSGEAEVIVTGPKHPQPFAVLTTIACSLHPLGLPLADLPEGVLDFSSEALAQPDQHVATRVDQNAIAWVDAERAVPHRELLADPVSARILVPVSTPWLTLSRAVLGPLAGGGSAVVVDGTADQQALARIAAAEHAAMA